MTTDAQQTQKPQTLAELEHEVDRFLRRFRALAQSLATQLDPQLDFSGYLLAVAVHEGDGGDGVRGTDLAESFGVHKSTISRGLSQLEAIGLVQRTIDLKDRRSRRVHLTPDGRRRLTAVRQSRWDHFEEVVRTWDEADTATLATLLNRLTAALERAEGPQG